MAKTNASYTKKSRARTAAAKEAAAHSKQLFSQTKFSIRFSRDGIIVEHTRKI